MSEIAEELKVIVGEVVKRIESKTLFTCKVSDRGTSVLIYNARVNKECVGTIYVFEDMLTVYERCLDDPKDSYFTEEAVGSVFYSDPGFFDKTIKLMGKL